MTTSDSRRTAFRGAVHTDSPASESPAAEETAAAISLAGVSKHFGSKPVLDGLDLDVPQGEVFALLGANGAGKTTCINILTTLVRPDTGTVRVMGVDVRTSPGEAKRHFAVTGQSAAVDTYLSTEENLVLLGRLSGLNRRTAKVRSRELAEKLSLTDFMTTRVGALSGGMRRRLDLALSLVVPVEILILDEPTTGLDTRSRQELWGEVGALARGGTTVFLTTQYLDEADALADRIGLLDRGRLAGLGTPRELKARIGEDTVAVRGADGSHLSEIPTDGTVGGLVSALEPWTVESPHASVSLHSPSLDDVFFAFTSADSSH
ncbi:MULTISPECIES: ABC transporter ATP-binding protein [unclassified Brevibacterium]|uniref:ABC transporter ATP-binding protein n=1 Tax=unclassified Brevibacterium TaxID=2614124 RepID=UPI001091A214|nr:ATP-binding cassette domain-containing protein [Brevibacterium sp. S22]TGD27293.1 ATP-binding cassette domain-containing protein [Brevibacterium sp. S22]